MFGRVAVAHRAPQHRQREAVDLEEDDAGRVRLRRAALPPRDALDDAQRVRVVVVRREITSSTTPTAAMTSAASSAQPKEST